MCEIQAPRPKSPINQLETSPNGSLLAAMAILETSHEEVDVAAVQLLGL